MLHKIQIGRDPRSVRSGYLFAFSVLVLVAFLGAGVATPLQTVQPTPETLPKPDLTQTASAIRTSDLRLHVTYLASEAMDGRLTGTEGERLATDYVAGVFQFLGLEPAGDSGSYFQQFEFTAGVSLGPKNRLVLHQEGTTPSKRNFKLDQDWRPLAFSKTGIFDAVEIAFAGYGIVAPATDQFDGYDSFVHLDVTGKWVLVFRYLPEDIKAEYRQHLARFATLRYKAMVARDKGAHGLIVVSGPNSQVKKQLVKLDFDASVAGTSIAGISIADTVATLLLQSADKDLKALQDTLDSGALMMGFVLPGLSLEAELDIEQEKRLGRSVLARLKAGDKPAASVVVVGGHVDHLGHGLGTSSLARPEEKGMIHYGADDNASGTAAVLEIAQYLSDQKATGHLPMRRDLLFAAWSGEELGILGSSHFVNTYGGKDIPSDSLRPAISAYLNLDMIGRLDRALILNGIGSSSIWPEEIERHNASIGLSVRLQNDSYLPTDATAFYVKGVPILSAFTGAHEDYHTPRDTADKINYEGAADITRFMARVIRSLVTREEAPDYIAQARPDSLGDRAGLRVYLGTIPDYAQGDVAGVKLSGVSKGGPADKAGIKGGDVIVELAGKKIENIYDYTYAIDAVKIGVPVEIVVQRGDQRLTLTITPASRE